MRITAGELRDAALTFEEAVDLMPKAVGAFVNGDIGPWIEICSHADDASLRGGWGGWERGWSQLEPRYAWAAARFVSGDVSIEEVAKFVNGILGIPFGLSDARPSSAEPKARRRWLFE